MRSKAMLAIVFAGGLLNSPMPTQSASESKSADSVIQQIADNAQLTPEDQAYYLLMIASCYLKGDSQTAVDAQFTSAAKQTNRGSLYSKRQWECPLVYWADKVSEDLPTDGKKIENKSNLKPIPDESSALADKALNQAFTELDKVSQKFEKLNMYYIASRLFQEMGNIDGMRKCNKILEQAFRSCEGRSPIEDEDQVKAASSILNSMANGFIAVHIPNEKPTVRRSLPQIQVTPFTEKDFKESERLKLRALAMVDRLAPKNHLRRKAHRDLALWYTQLGKRKLAEKQKQVLFELVGRSDDSILYPQSASCGQLVWWEPEDIKMGTTSELCGMG
jgi:hypothetical protein